MDIESKQQILARRKELEQELADMLERTGSGHAVQDIADEIYREEGTDAMTRIIAMFDRGGGAAELSDVLELVSDAWNYFPHQIIGGVSPAEKLLEHRQKDS